MDGMNVEDNRLQTFENWPASAVVDSTRIARAGFFSTGNDLEVECFSCALKISEWNIGDQVMTRHRQLSPNCEFVTNPTSSGNVPATSANTLPSTSSQATSQPPPHSDDDMTIVENRLKTFSSWPPIGINPKELAEAGFFYLNEGDRVQCFSCHRIIRSWEPGDVPLVEHIKFIPNCQFAKDLLKSKKRNQDQISLANNQDIVSSPNLQELGVQVNERPHRPNMATLEARLLTYAKWPANLIQTPNILAEAGFYYTGWIDSVRCFHCDGGLSKWEPQDEPWKEHARWLPNCNFLLRVKGQAFVSQVQNELTQQRSPNTSNVNLISIRRSVSERRRVVTDDEVQNALNTSVARAALGVGLHLGRVKQAIKSKLEQTGSNFATADALIEAALNIQRDEAPEIHDDTIPESHLDLHQPRENLDFSDTHEPLPSESSFNRNSPKEAASAKAATEAKAEALEDDTAKLTETVLMSLEEENRRLKDQRLCKICLDNELGIVFLPCGHLAACVDCAPNFKDCPVCRTAVKAFVRTFLA